MAGRRWWGPLFPDAAHRGPCYFGPLFPDCAAGMNPAIVPGVGPAGVALLVLNIDSGATVRMSYSTDIIKSKDATEKQRIAAWDLPRCSYSGAAWLIDPADRRTTRAVLEGFAALGKPFRLALPHEEATILSDATGNVLHVGDTSKLDWAVSGQRSAVVSADRTEAIPAVVQATTSTTITIDVAPGLLGRRGCTIMPTVSVLLDAQQGFVRYPNPDGPEQWQIQAKQDGFGFRQVGHAASVALATFTPLGQLVADTAVFTSDGAIGNTASLEVVADAGAPVNGILDTGPNVVRFRFKPGSTTFFYLRAALDTTNIKIVGGWPNPALVMASTDAISLAALSGGLDDILGYMGRGATIQTWNGKPVWDRGVQLGKDGTASDSLQSMVELIDLNGVLQQYQTAPAPDWGRQASLDRDDPDDYQWAKAFVSEVRGCQGSFWMPTQAPDLEPVTLDINGGFLTIRSTQAMLTAWAPHNRTCLQIRMLDGSLLWCRFEDSVDNLDGTLTLTLLDPSTPFPGGAPLLVEVDMVSWMDPCRFEGDDFDYQFTGGQMALKKNARAVRQ